MSDGLRFLLEVILTAVVVIASIVGLTHLKQKASCNEKAAAFEHEYSFFGGCMIKSPETGRWIPLSNYREVGK